MKSVLLMIGLLVASSYVLAHEDIVTNSEVDFVHYLAELEPNFEKKLLRGSVTISFVPTTKSLSELIFSSKYKQIESVKLNGDVVSYSLVGEQLVIKFESQLEEAQIYSLKVDYSASPERGMKFYDDHLFTVYHTKNWLVSHDDISDKATFELFLTHDVNLSMVGNGRLVSRVALKQNKEVSHWRQDTPIPMYTFGFVIGQFDTLFLKADDLDISILFRKSELSGLTPSLLSEAFVDVADMLTFFEKKAGFALNQGGYHYVVVNGHMAQEASGFSLVGEKFVHTVLLVYCT